MQRGSIARVTAVILACLLVGGSVTLVAQGQDPFVGTWELNAAKSTFSVPATAYKSSTIRIEGDSKEQKVAVQTVGTSGKPIEYEFKAAFDGQDYAVPTIGTVTLKRVDARTVERIHKTAGKPMMTFLTRVSQDGKTMTISQTGTSPTGLPVKNTLVYEKK